MTEDFLYLFNRHTFIYGAGCHRAAEFMRVDFYTPACYNKKNDRLAPPGGNV